MTDECSCLYARCCDIKGYDLLCLRIIDKFEIVLHVAIITDCVYDFVNTNAKQLCQLTGQNVYWHINIFLHHINGCVNVRHLWLIKIMTFLMTWGGTNWHLTNSGDYSCWSNQEYKWNIGCPCRPSDVLNIAWEGGPHISQAELGSRISENVSCGRFEDTIRLMSARIQVRNTESIIIWLPHQLVSCSHEMENTSLKAVTHRVKDGHTSWTGDTNINY